MYVHTHIPRTDPSSRFLVQSLTLMHSAMNVPILYLVAMIRTRRSEHVCSCPLTGLQCTCGEGWLYHCLVLDYGVHQPFPLHGYHTENSKFTALQNRDTLTFSTAYIENFTGDKFYCTPYLCTMSISMWCHCTITYHEFENLCGKLFSQKDYPLWKFYHIW